MKFYKYDDEYVIMTPAAFKKMFGMTYSDFQSSESSQMMSEEPSSKYQSKKQKKARKIKFADAHCCVDPYAEDINGEISPIVCSSFEQMDDLRYQYAMDI